MPRSAFVVLSWLGILALFAVVVFAIARPSGDDPAAASGSEAPAEVADTPSAAASVPAPAPSAPPDGAVALSQEDIVACVAPDAANPQELVGSQDIPDGSAQEQVDEIGDLVVDLRDLTFEEDPDPQFLGDDEISERLETEVREEYDEQEADLDARLLAALGAVPRDIDLVETQADLLSAQVAGFYDPDTGELVVRTGDTDDGLDPPAQSVLAHELQHAVADQRLELPVDTTEDLADADAGLAALSVIEGDASLTQQQFIIVGLSLDEQISVLQDPTVIAAQEQLEDVPHYLARSLEFPYTTGFEFVCTQYLDGGWDAVDALYDELPTTSLEIMDPSRYPFDPTDPRDPSAPGDGWSEERTTTLGAADLWWLFEAPGGDEDRALDDARAAALEWTGGELTLWTRDDDTAVGVALSQRGDDGPLCDAVATWYQRAFPDGEEAPPRSGERLVHETDAQTGVVTCDGDEVRLGIGPDLSTARAVVR